MKAANIGGVLVVVFALGSQARAQERKSSGPEVWIFDRIENIGGLPTTVLGHPRVIDTALGKAVEFNGIDDALFIGEHPLAGAETFTFEAIFRPDPGGAPEQRWFHLSEQDPATGKDTDTRLLFETRLIADRWCLDAFVNTPAGNKALLDRGLLHPLGAWYHVAMVYDGTEFRSYVNRVLQGKAAVAFVPEGKGRASVGVRINRVNFFKGAVREARFTRRALQPEEFLTVHSEPK
ncbi:MAG TPA: LamG domain-containing protein [Bryobacteraceae bacterium]|nr:LamG domain-containing protein [Bryobacteraceae bacterium]